MTRAHRPLEFLQRYVATGLVLQVAVEPEALQETMVVGRHEGHTAAPLVHTLLQKCVVQ